MGASGWRIGSVPYLNARPLICGLQNVRLLEPAALAEEFARGELDAALAPVVESFEHPEYRIASRWGICCRGDVYSVIIAHRTPLSRLRRIYLDPASRTSNLLLEFLCRNHWKISAQLSSEPAPERLAADEGRLLIGDPAIQFRLRNDAEWMCTDLGASWWKLTGRPFVFALWLTAPDAASDQLTAMLDEAGAKGRERRGQIAADQREIPIAIAREYLTRYIRYSIGPEERQSIEFFKTESRRLGCLNPDGRNANVF